MGLTVRERFENIQERVAAAALRSGRAPSEVCLVAAVKRVPVDRVLEAVEAGVKTLGENYVQEAQRLKEQIPSSVHWHMIGNLQSKKARQAVRLFDVVETVDREKIVNELQRCAQEEGKRLDVMVQVDLAGEPTKSGADPAQTRRLIETVAACENLRCVGLMTMPPFFDDPEGARPTFSELRRLRDRLQPTAPQGVELRELSMGMSGDFEVAVEEGATLVRIGTALFGPRQP
ncbi:MAG: YggS family pyridoxal phosphate-dependent enzyme [Thermodesulfobacteriota bacterium]